MRVLNGNIICSNDETLNFLEYENKVYRISPLVDVADLEGGKGGNSNVFKLFDPDFEIPGKEDSNFFILKFCKYPISTTDENLKIRIARFQTEIRALRKAKHIQHVITLKFNDALEIDGEEYLYYVMEKGDGDMLDFMRSDTITNQQKFVLCREVLMGIKELHDLGIYHRDIKPDNIFFVDNVWKVGDLGLIDNRDEAQKLDVIREKIGPSGWLSPEAVNKMLCEDTSYESVHCCTIGSYSDVFQIGKLVWYIFEGTIPVGQVNKTNFKLGNERIYDLLIKMLQHLKDDRPTIEEAIDLLDKEAYYFRA